MFWIDLMFIVVFALGLSFIMAWGIGWRHPARAEAAGASILFLFIVLFVSMWAGAGWFRPWGPVVYGTPWLSLLLFGIFVSLLILAVSVPFTRPRTAHEAEAQAETAAAVGKTFGIFFWILIGVLIVAGIFHYWA